MVAISGMAASPGILGDLADPARLQEPINIENVEPSVLQGFLRRMVLIRLVEQHLAEAKKEGLIGGPVHLGVGQEAIAVGVSRWLRASDRVFGTHRSHAHVLALGASIRALLAETLGKDTGLSLGMGGSMHLWDKPHGFYGSVPIVAGTVPLAVGAALAAKLSGTDDIAVSYFGDGAVEEGVVQESFNLARMLKAPLLFVVENNLFASHMHISLRQPLDSTARFAAAHDIRYEVVDGNDVVALSGAVERLVRGARQGDGPGLLEAVTYRWYGHVDWREDIDVGVNRSIEDLTNWRARDPVARLKTAMQRAGIWSSSDHEALVRELAMAVAEAWNQAMQDPWPEPRALLERVYASRESV